MSLLRVYPDDTNPNAYHEHQAPEAINEHAAPARILFERWPAEKRLEPGASQEAILDAYRESVERLKQAAGFVTANVVSVHPETPGHPAMRQKFLREHTHTEDEARFFVDGAGLFVIHHDRSVLCLLCERGDLIKVPAGTRHWFDMGPSPHFTAIRLFTRPEGWVATFTGSDVSDRFPHLGAEGLEAP